MKSKKPVKQLDDIILPFLITSSQDISLNHNGQNLAIKKGIPTEITRSQFDILLNNPDYAKELKG